MGFNPILVAAKVTSVLEKIEVPYFIGGSVASTLHGMVRTTQDIDIVTRLRPEKIAEFVGALRDEFYIDEEMVASAVSRHSSFNIIHRETMFKVDIFIPAEDRFTESQFSRAQQTELETSPRVQAAVASPEDMVLAKLLWYRRGGEVSERQWRDILGLLKVQGSALDLDYLRKIAIEIKVADLLERALKEGKM